MSEQILMNNAILAWHAHNSDGVIGAFYPDSSFAKGYFFNELHDLVHIYNTPRVGLYTYTHKDFEPLSSANDIYAIVTGKELENEYPLNVYRIEPDSELAEKCDSYGELSATYYMWKHPEIMDGKDYVGIQHYSKWWAMTGKYQVEGLFEIHNFECITPLFNNDMPISMYEFQRRHHTELDELDFCLEYIKEHYPEYSDTIQTHVYQVDQTYWCNMAIMRKDWFMVYCNFIFDVIEAMNDHFGLHTRADFDEYQKTHEQYNIFENDQFYRRLNGYIGESLTSLFIQHNFHNVGLMPISIKK